MRSSIGESRMEGTWSMRIGEVSERSSGGAALDVSDPYGHGEAKVSTTAGSTLHSDGPPLRLD
jgi:hypothetical protein